MRPASDDAILNRPQTCGPSCMPARTVALVDAGPESLAQLDCHLEMGRYALIFLDSRMRPYSDIKYLHPTLIVVSMRFESPSGCQVLTLLKLDPETRNIPVLVLLAAEGEQSEGAVTLVSAPLWAD